MGKSDIGDELVIWDFVYNFKFKKIDARFDQLWAMKASARESLKRWLVVSGIPPRTAEICANACSELTENSIKYTPNGSIATVSIHVRDDEIIVETINPAEQEHIEALNQSLEALHTASDPREVFVDKLMHPIEGKSQLGLIKIVVETEGALELVKCDDDHTIHMELKIKAA